MGAVTRLRVAANRRDPHNRDSFKWDLSRMFRANGRLAESDISLPAACNYPNLMKYRVEDIQADHWPPPTRAVNRLATKAGREVLKPEELKLERCLKNREGSLVVFGCRAGRYWPRP